MSNARGIVAVAATYIYFLIFAQFAFLELAKHASVQAQQLNYIMAPMGLCGLAASVLCGWKLPPGKEKLLLIYGFLFCAVFAVISTRIGNSSQSLLYFGLNAAGIGVGLSVVTVALATSLRTICAPHYFGTQVGLGTGIAYFICNFPPLFQATAEAQAIVAAGVALAASTLLVCSRDQRKQYSASNGIAANASQLKLSRVVSIFLALVWLDSAAFFVIQQTTGLKTATWGDPNQLWLNGSVHFIFALLAGALLDRKYFGTILIGAYSFLAAGVLSLMEVVPLKDYCAVFYVAGVSLYSTVLVAYPSLEGEAPNSFAPRMRAGLVYGIAGWFGSAMGIGMATDLHRVPLWFLGLAGVVVIGATSSHSKTTVSARLALLLFIFCDFQLAQAEPSPERGKTVYIQEGCMHCHSQYVRPGTGDVEAWGPFQVPERILLAHPPLIGNRRLAPDLLNVGNRRSDEWQRLHLSTPQILLPGSTMPSYQHLFTDSRGEDLISYLHTLGAETLGEHWHFVETWTPAAGTVPVTARESNDLYQALCASCHGEHGRADGPLASKLSIPPRNLATDTFRYLDEHAEDAEAKLARIIKFGIAGTPMAGHEYLAAGEVLGIAEYVMSLRGSAKASQ